MKKVKTKSIVDDDITEMFNQMVGIGNPDLGIITPKYKKIRCKVNSLSQIFKLSLDVLSGVDGIDDLGVFSDELKSIEFVDEKKLTTEYNTLKDHSAIKKIILTLNSLIGFKDSLNSNDCSFILRHPGGVLNPFPFSPFNVKDIWNTHSDHIKKYTMTMLQVVFGLCNDVYSIITSPDVDVKNISSVIVSSIANAKKHIPRCDKAFSQIEKSVSMLENNFDGYYKDFLQSNRPTSILEGFIMDVSNKSDIDAQTTFQFRKIISHYRKMSSGNISDPRINKLFKVLNHNLDLIDKK